MQLNSDFQNLFYDLRYIKKIASAKFLANELGIKLAAGVPLASALENLGSDRISTREKDSLERAYKKIKSGASPAQVFSDRSISLLDRDRYILSLPIQDKEKGNILKAWSNDTKNMSLNSRVAIQNVFVTIAFSFVFITTLFNFVLPQFVGILSGFDGKTSSWLLSFNNILSFMHDNGIYIIFPVILSVVSLLIFYFCHAFFNSKKIIEESNLLDVIASVPQSEQWKYLEYVSNKTCFPNNFKAFERISNSVKRGENIEEGIANSGVTSHLVWLLQLSLHDKSRLFIKEGALMLSERARLTSNGLTRLAEALVAMFNGFIVLFVIIYMYGMLNAILMGAIME